jgi:hypothetical protein
VAYLPLGHLGHVSPAFEKYPGHLGCGPPLVFGNFSFISELLAAAAGDHLMYRLEYPFSLAIHYYHLCLTSLFIVTVVGLMLHAQTILKGTGRFLSMVC